MTPAQFRQARKALGFTGASLAERWGMGKHGARSIRNWEAGRNVPVNPIAAYCIGIMLQHNDTAPPPPPAPPKPPKPKPPKRTKLEKRLDAVEQDRETRMLARVMASIKLPE